MRITTMVGTVILMGMLAACETTGDDAAAEVEAPPGATGGAGGLADDAIITLQVEDYQQHLDQVIREYRFCVEAEALANDDGSMDPARVVELAQRSCEDEYRTVHRTANLLGENQKIQTLRAESQAGALDAVVAARSL